MKNWKAISTMIGLVIILAVGGYALISNIFKDAIASNDTDVTETALPSASAEPIVTATAATSAVPSSSPTANTDTSITDTNDPIASAAGFDPEHPYYIKGQGYLYKDDADFLISDYGDSAKTLTAAHDYGLSIYGVYYLTEIKDVSNTLTGYHVHTYTQWYDYLLKAENQGTAPPDKNS
jgi:hypothetical protein